MLVVMAISAMVAVGLGVPSGGAATIGWLGRIAGAAGLASLLVAGIISVRIPGFDLAFGGLARLWNLHHRLGLAAFVLVLSHPPLMVLSRVPTGTTVIGDLLFPALDDPAMWSGWIAVAAMVLFLGPSFQLYGRPEYQRWKTLHFMAGVTLLAGLVHTIPLTRAFPAPWPTIVWGGLGGLALVVFVWRATIARPLLRESYAIVDRRRIGDKEVELSLRREDGGTPLGFHPGQFVYLTPLDPSLTRGRNEEHPYTLSSAPGEQTLRIAIKNLGDATAALQQVSIGSRARIEGPYGDFLPERLRHETQLWIGGGIGITPFVSAARSIDLGAAWGPVDLLFCVNDPSRIYFLEELEAISARSGNPRVHPHYFADQGPLDRTFVARQCPDAARRHWFVCGPTPLVLRVRRLARALGVPNAHIHTEDFNFL